MKLIYFNSVKSKKKMLKKGKKLYSNDYFFGLAAKLDEKFQRRKTG
jgi:hypothetical protein